MSSITKIFITIILGLSSAFSHADSREWNAGAKQLAKIYKDAKTRTQLSNEVARSGYYSSLSASLVSVSMGLLVSRSKNKLVRRVAIGTTAIGLGAAAYSGVKIHDTYKKDDVLFNLEYAFGPELAAIDTLEVFFPSAEFKSSAVFDFRSKALDPSSDGATAANRINKLILGDVLTNEDADQSIKRACQALHESLAKLSAQYRSADRPQWAQKFEIALKSSEGYSQFSAECTKVFTLYLTEDGHP